MYTYLYGKEKNKELITDKRGIYMKIVSIIPVIKIVSFMLFISCYLQHIFII